MLCLVFVTLLFVDFTGVLHAWLGWMAKIQFLPALLALNAGVIVCLILLTLVAGRVYCSVICPLGVFQDVVARLGRGRKKMPYTYSKPKSWLRYGVLAVFVLAMLLGVHALVALLDPYAVYGRAAHSFLQPLWMWGNNLLASMAERMDSYAFYSVDVWLKSLPVLIVAAVMLVLVVVLAARNGRTYCNTICPVGTVLGFFSRFALFRITIDKEKCNGCTLCARNCKAACIDVKNHAIDGSRCVACMDCLDKCHKGAIGYRFAYGKKAEKAETPAPEIADRTAGRREFLAGSLLLAGSVLKAQVAKKAEAIKMDGGLADIVDKKEPVRQTPIVPPGARGLRHLQSHCTGLPALRVGLSERSDPSFSFAGYFHAALHVVRTRLLPSGVYALFRGMSRWSHPGKIDKAEKSSIQIGHAVWVKDLCIPLTDKQECGNCARHCPVNAITMVPSDPSNPDSLKIPAMNEARCIGCGACENLCPARPLSAIYVEGHERHRVL